MPARSINAFQNKLDDVLNVMDLRGLMWFRRLGVFTIVGTVEPIVSPASFGVGRIVGAK